MVGVILAPREESLKETQGKTEEKRRRKGRESNAILMTRRIGLVRDPILHSKGSYRLAHRCSGPMGPTWATEQHHPRKYSGFQKQQHKGMYMSQ
jgi:hypothetical protein